MKLAGQTVAVILTEEGKAILGQAVTDLPDSSILVTVEETDDLGVWIRVAFDAQVHFLLIRWEFILLMDVTREQGRFVGLKG